MKRMIDELDARSALENDIDGNGGGVVSVAGSNESEAGRAARCRELPGRSRAGWMVIQFLFLTSNQRFGWHDCKLAIVKDSAFRKFAS